SKIDNYSHIMMNIDSLQIDNLRRNLKLIAKYLDDLKNTRDVREIEDELFVAVNLLQERVDAYNDAAKNPHFLDELKNAYIGLSGKFLAMQNDNINK
ncbi:hypothetical protein COBT_003652, partial [Conglomerata obtusa]